MLWKAFGSASAATYAQGPASASEAYQRPARRAHGAEHRVAAAELEQGRARLRGVDALLELARRPGVDGGAGVGGELDDAQGAVARQVDARRDGDPLGARAAGEDRRGEQQCESGRQARVHLS
jgi:hypothetical protein